MARDLPSGTVTFLFTDVEGSTTLLHSLGDAGYAEVLAEHRRLAPEAFAVTTASRSTRRATPSSSRSRPRDGALDGCAATAIDALAPDPITVRVGIHTGTAGRHGRGLRRRRRPPGRADRREPGTADRSSCRSERSSWSTTGDSRSPTSASIGSRTCTPPSACYQLGDETFPPIRSLSPSNLPVPATPFVGRRHELDSIAGLLPHDDVSLVTLTGPGGTGKTRLALQAAAEAAESFPDGLWWVPLAPSSPTPISSFRGSRSRSDVAEEAETPLVETLHQTAGRPKRALVLLDNAEHLLPKSPTDVAPLTRRRPAQRSS